MRIKPCKILPEPYLWEHYPETASHHSYARLVNAGFLVGRVINQIQQYGVVVVEYGVAVVGIAKTVNIPIQEEFKTVHQAKMWLEATVLTCGVLNENS